jgi:hypothetical protein
MPKVSAVRYDIDVGIRHLIDGITASASRLVTRPGATAG